MSGPIRLAVERGAHPFGLMAPWLRSAVGYGLDRERRL